MIQAKKKHNDIKIWGLWKNIATRASRVDALREFIAKSAYEMRKANSNPCFLKNVFFNTCSLGRPTKNQNSGWTS